MPSGKKRKRHKVATHKRKKRARANVTKRKSSLITTFSVFKAFIEIGLKSDKFQIKKSKSQTLLLEIGISKLKFDFIHRVQYL